MKLNNKSGFTLLEIIIVIIIVGVLASLALPRFFATVEYSKSTEALNSMATVRQALERCYLQKGGDYTGCNVADLDVEDPGNSPGAHFTYAISGQAPAAYKVTATRNSYDGTSAQGHIIYVEQDATGVSRGGDGIFSGIN